MAIHIWGAFDGRAQISVGTPYEVVGQSFGNIPVQNNVPVSNEPAESFNPMPIIAMVLSCTVYLSPIGLVLGSVYLGLGKKRMRGLSIASVIVGGIFSFFLLIAFLSSLG